MSLQGRHAQQRAQLLALKDLTRGAVGAVEPFSELAKFDSVLDADISHGDSDAALANTRDPVIPANGEERLSDGLVQG